VLLAAIANGTSYQTRAGSHQGETGLCTLHGLKSVSGHIIGQSDVVTQESEVALK
jgi:hypothetical protein